VWLEAVRRHHRLSDGRRRWVVDVLHHAETRLSHALWLFSRSCTGRACWSVSGDAADARSCSRVSYQQQPVSYQRAIFDAVVVVLRSPSRIDILSTATFQVWRASAMCYFCCRGPGEHLISLVLFSSCFPSFEISRLFAPSSSSLVMQSTFKLQNRIAGLSIWTPLHEFLRSNHR
jgi:hypothetical protein